MLNKKTYWSNQDTMQQWVTNILVPFWMSVKSNNGLPPDQACMLQLDCWSVHCNSKFWLWLESSYPWIVLDYIPRGCTGIWQPMDVGLQKPFKACIKHMQNKDVVLETMEKLDLAEHHDNALELDDTIGTLQDHSVSWFIDAMDCVQDPVLVKKAFEVCHKHRVQPIS
jgi:hypothetical protein